MTGVVEAGTVLGLISAIIAICEAAEEIYEAAGDLKGLPKKFRTAAEQIPLVYYTLGLAETDIKANKVGKEALQSVIPVLEQCKGSAASLKEIFDKTLPGKDDSTAKRVFSGVKILYKSNKVKSYMEDVFQNLQLLAEHQVFQDAKTLGQITEAIEQLENASDEQEQSQFVNSGAGSINANTSSGTQNNNNNTGSGQMYNAQTQHFVVYHSPPVLNSTSGLPDAKRVKPNYSNQKHPTGGVWMVPFERNDSFTSRDDELKTVRLLLFKQDRTAKVAITGLGGIGKTHLVLELLYRIREEEEYKHCSVLWIPAMSEESLSQAYLEAAKELGIPGWDDKSADVKQLVQHHLGDKATGKWILVFDNADEISMWLDAPHPNSRRLLDYLPKNSQGSIIFTTRNAKLADELANHHVVEVLDMGETGGKKVLRNYLRNQDLLKNEEDTVALLKWLTYLPLAIVQAARYINQNKLSLRRYLFLLDEQEEDVVEMLSKDFNDNGRYSNGKNPIATTWLVSFAQLRERSPLAADYLSFMACVDTKDIPQTLLPPGQSRDKEADAIGALIAYSFISQNPESLSISIHRLVHLATRNWLRKEKQLLPWAHDAVIRLGEVLQNPDYTNRDVWRSYMPHAYYVLKSAFIEDNDTDRLNLLKGYGECLYLEGRYQEAEASMEEVMESYKTKLRVDHPDTLTSMANLASTLWNQGRWGEAEKLEVQVMETRKTKLGVDHPDTLTSMANLASTYRNQGRWEEAEKLEVQVMETSRTKLGVDHPDTLTSMAYLASTYSNQGRWEEAEKLEVQVMETSKTKLGVDHPDTLTSMANLASTYRNQGRWGEAEKLEVQVMETSRTKLGVDHPHTLTSMANLASTYRNQGRWGEAEKLEVQVMETSRTKLGVDHPHTLTSMANLASTLWNQGLWKEAEKLEIQVMETSKTKLGVDHPDTLTSIANLALTYSDQGRWGEAEKLEVQVMETRKTKLGADHPDTLTSMYNLAFTWRGQGRHIEALALMKDCVLASQRTIGLEHPHTVSAAAVLQKWLE